MTRAYVRVSTKKQEEGLSLQAQVQRIKAAVNGQPLKIYQDVASGRYLKRRPQLLQLLVDMKKGDKVVVVRLDRIARSTKDLADMVMRFKEQGVSFSSLSDSFNLEIPTGEFLVTILGAVAQLESQMNGQRVHEACQIAKENGRILGSLPYGVKLDDSGKRIPDEAEIRVVKTMRRLRRKKLGYDRVARELNRQGYVPRRGEKFYGSVVNGILKNLNGKRRR